jgi:hypothetical protein
LYLVSFYPTKWQHNSAGAPNFSPQKLTLFVLGAPISGMLVYLVPLARSRYCASPEASIMRLKAAATLGASGERPYYTQGRAPVFFPTKWLHNFAGAPNFSPQKLTLFLFGDPDLLPPKTHLVRP